MQLGQVIGTVVATIRTPGLDGVRFLLVQPLDRAGRPSGEPVVAGDGVHMAGPGELVTIVASREAALAMPDTFVPLDHAIVGIVDQLAVDGELRDARGRSRRKPKGRRRADGGGSTGGAGRAPKGGGSTGGAGRAKAPGATRGRKGAGR